MAMSVYALLLQGLPSFQPHTYKLWNYSSYGIVVEFRSSGIGMCWQYLVLAKQRKILKFKLAHMTTIWLKRERLIFLFLYY